MVATQDISVCEEIIYGLDDPGFILNRGMGFFLCTMPRPALGPTQLLVHKGKVVSVNHNISASSDEGKNL